MDNGEITIDNFFVINIKKSYFAENPLDTGDFGHRFDTHR